jgi:hypothetical protein
MQITSALEPELQLKDLSAILADEIETGIFSRLPVPSQAETQCREKLLL